MLEEAIAMQCRCVTGASLLCWRPLSMGLSLESTQLQRSFRASILAPHHLSSPYAHSAMTLLLT